MWFSVNRVNRLPRRHLIICLFNAVWPPSTITNNRAKFCPRKFGRSATLSILYLQCYSKSLVVVALCASPSTFCLAAAAAPACCCCLVPLTAAAGSSYCCSWGTSYSHYPLIGTVWVHLITSGSLNGIAMVPYITPFLSLVQLGYLIITVLSTGTSGVHLILSLPLSLVQLGYTSYSHPIPMCI